MNSLKEIPKSERPRERLYQYGPSKLSNEELLSIILKSGNKKYSLKEIVLGLLSHIDNIKDLKKENVVSLMQIPGISQIKAIELVAVLELGKRVYAEISLEEVISCTTPTNIIKYFNYLFQDKKQEEFYVIYLDNSKKFLAKKKLFIGTISSSLVHPREIFKEAYLLSASYLICLHNHPSGNCLPSKEDIDITRKIKEIGVIHSIFLIDHIIIGQNNYYSFYENNHII